MSRGEDDDDLPEINDAKPKKSKKKNKSGGFQSFGKSFRVRYCSFLYMKG